MHTYSYIYIGLHTYVYTNFYIYSFVNLFPITNTLIPGMWAAPWTGEAYDSTLSPGQTGLFDADVGIPVRSMGGGSDVVKPFWNWWGSRHACRILGK